MHDRSGSGAQVFGSTRGYISDLIQAGLVVRSVSHIYLANMLL